MQNSKFINGSIKLKPRWRKSLGIAGSMLLLGVAQSLLAQVNCTDFATTDFKKVVLVNQIESPLKMAIATDGRILYIERSGAVRLLKPGATAAVQALKLTVPAGSQNEDGLLGIALDPKFATNSWVYLFHTLANPIGYRLSRFTLVGDVLDPASEKVVFKFNHLFTSYGNLIIHGAGAIAFDPQGNLLISTGDLMHTTDGPTQTPVVEASLVYDAQRTSANSNSYFGKILRITPKDDGTYSVPAGNLFPATVANTIPEIYAMGVRNPFTLTIDPKTGWAYSGEVGPDGSDGAIPSQDEINQIKQAGNFGWPYLTGDNQAYAGTDGKKFDANALVNNSKNNSGIKDLPAPVKSLFWYGYKSSWPLTGILPNNGNRCIKIGGFYRFNPSGTNPKRLPPAFDNGFFMANHNDNEPLRFFKLDAAGALVSAKTVVSGLARPISSEVGPDGSLYIIEWGSDNGHWFNGKNGIISRLEYTGTCSTTKLAKHFSSQQLKKSSLLVSTPGMEIPFPTWASQVNIFDVQGHLLFSTSVAKLGQSLKPVMPTGIPAGIIQLHYQ